MNLATPELSQFSIHALDQITAVDHPSAEVSYRVSVEPTSITRRLVVGLQDGEGHGISVAIFPATGEVCDLNNGGEVIGYLSSAPLMPNESIPCDLKLFRFGKNVVCSVRINGEVFLYPAFSLSGDAPLTAFIGQEDDGTESKLVWSGLQLDLLEASAAA